MTFKPNTLGKRKPSNSKKANQHKLRVIRNAQAIMDNITICNIFVPEDKENGWGNSAVYQKDKQIKVPPSLAWHLDNIRVKWEVTCGIFNRTQSGEHYFKYFTFQATQECHSFDVAEQAQKVCAYLFKNAVIMEKLCPFWLAVPRTNDQKDVNLNLAIRTAHTHKVFNRIGTNFEHNCNIPFKDFHQGDWFDIPINWEKTGWIDIDLNEALSLEINVEETKDGNVIV